MTQANESLGLTASQHIEKILQSCGRARKRLFDYALINTAPISPTDTLDKYAREGQEPIVNDLDRIRALGVEPVTGDFRPRRRRAAARLRSCGRDSALLWWSATEAVSIDRK